MAEHIREIAVTVEVDNVAARGLIAGIAGYMGADLVTGGLGRRRRKR